MRERWQPVGLMAVALFAVDIVARLVARAGGFNTDSAKLTLGLVAVIAVAVLLVGASAWWSVRYPSGRVFTDLGLAQGIAALLTVVIGPYVSGTTPFANGLGYFVAEVLMFLAVAFAGIFLGFLAMVAVGKDWKSRGLRRYAENYRARPHRSVRS